jgi:ankyrin repeat protein
MFYAALGGNVQVMRYLLDHGADPAMPQERGSTPLHNAAEEGGLTFSLLSSLSVPEIEGVALIAYKEVTLYMLW